MPKVFLIRKRRQHWRMGPCGTVTPPPSPEQLDTSSRVTPQTKQEEPQSPTLTDLAPQTRWTETCQKIKSRTESGRGEAGTSPPISPTRPQTPCNPERYRPLVRPSSFRENLFSAESEESDRPSPPSIAHYLPSLSSMQPAYLAVPVIQAIATQDRPLNYHVSRVEQYNSYEDIDEDVQFQTVEQDQTIDHHELHFQQKLRMQNIHPLIETCEDTSQDPYRFDGRPLSPTDSDSNSSKSPDSSEEKMAMMPSLPVRLALLQQKLGLSTDALLELVNGGHGIKNPFLQRNSRHPEEMSPLPTACQEMRSPKEPGRLSCHVCGKTFGLQRLLNRHMKCHSDMKRYLCTFCGKGFNDTFDLKRHTRTHTGVRPYKCNLCEKSFTQRCSLESHTLKVHGIQHQYAYKERRAKVYVCEECGHTTTEPEVHYVHLKQNHPYSPALLKFYDKRHFKFSDGAFPLGLLRVHS